MPRLREKRNHCRPIATFARWEPAPLALDLAQVVQNRWPVKAEHLLITLPLGRRVEARIRGHVIHTDQPGEKGGSDSAPTPYELFLASIGTCAGLFVQSFCSARGIPTGGIAIRQTVHYGKDGEIEEVELLIDLPSTFPEAFREPLLNAVDLSSVKRVLARPPRISAGLTQAPAMEAVAAY